MMSSQRNKEPIKAAYVIVAATTWLALSPGAQADCRPDPGPLIYKDASTTIVCDGEDTNGWPSEPVGELPPDHEFPVLPIDGLALIVLEDASVTGYNPDLKNFPVTITMPVGGSNLSVLNNGLIGSSGYLAEAIGLVGDIATVENNGTIQVDGAGGQAVGIEGAWATLSNTTGATIVAKGDFSEGMAIAGPAGRILNAGTVSANGNGAEGIGIEGADAAVTNNGLIAIAGEEAEGIGLEGTNGLISNTGHISATGTSSLGIGVLGSDIQVTNTGDISSVSSEITAAIGAAGESLIISNGPTGTLITSGDGAPAIAVLGHTIDITNDGSIETSGDQSDAIRFLQYGAPAPTPHEHISNGGTITTTGVEAVGILADAENATIENTGHITTSRTDAHGIALEGADGNVDNAGRIETQGGGANGIRVSAFAAHARARNLAGAQIQTQGQGAYGIRLAARAGAATNDGQIHTSGAGAHAIQVLGNDNRITNNLAGEILTEGNGATAISVLGDDSIIINAFMILTGGTAAHGIEVTGNGTEISNDGGLIHVIGDDSDAVHVSSPRVTISNIAGGLLRAAGARAAAICIASAEQASVFNSGTILSQNSASGDNYGIRATFAGSSPAGTRSIANLGTIQAVGIGARAVDVIGDNVEIRNGGPGIAGAGVTTNGSFNVGIGLTGRNPLLSNQAPIAVGDGMDAGLWGIEVTADAGGGFLVENSSTVTVSGTNGFGMVVRGAAAKVLPDATFAPGACVPSAGGRNLVNCGTIQLTGSDLTGILLEGTSDATVDNQIAIIGTGANLSGIAVRSLPGAPATLSTDNVITNFDQIVLDGPNAVGMWVKGHRNTVLSGSGSSLFPGGFLIDSFLDFVTDEDDDGTGPRTGNIMVTGDNAAGIVIEGNDNRVGARAFGQIVANGHGSAAVRLNGNNNLLVNDAVLFGAGAAIEGSDGAETVLNDGVINGDVRLMAGNDEMIITDATIQLGVVDGGDNVDTLRAVVPRPRIADPVSFTAHVDGSEYINFENVTKQGGGTLALVGDLTTWTTSVQEGQFSIEHDVTLNTVNATVEGTGLLVVQRNGALIAGGDVTLNQFGTLGVLEDGTVIANNIFVNSGATLFGKGWIIGNVVALGGTILPGASPGTLTIEGRLDVQGGVLEFEADSLSARDQLVVEGDVTLGGGFVDVILGFTPDPEDLLDFLVVRGALDIQEGFGGIRGFAAAGSGVALGTQFMVDLGGQVFQGTVTSAVPIPPSALLFGSGLLGLLGMARRQDKSRSAPAVLMWLARDTPTAWLTELQCRPDGAVRYRTRHAPGSRGGNAEAHSRAPYAPASWGRLRGPCTCTGDGAHPSVAELAPRPPTSSGPTPFAPRDPPRRSVRSVRPLAPTNPAPTCPCHLPALVPDWSSPVRLSRRRSPASRQPGRPRRRWSLALTQRPEEAVGTERAAHLLDRSALR